MPKVCTGIGGCFPRGIFSQDMAVKTMLSGAYSERDGKAGMLESEDGTRSDAVSTQY